MQQGFETLLLAELIDRERREAAARLHGRHRTAGADATRRPGRRRWSLRLAGAVLTVTLRNDARPATSGR
jgi:hypothetical protein